MELASHALKKIPHVEVTEFDGLLIDFMRSQEATIILRGMRVAHDFDYEFQLAGTNKLLAPDIESLFLMPAQNYACISSRFVREIAVMGGDVTPFVPRVVAEAFTKKFRK